MTIHKIEINNNLMQIANYKDAAYALGWREDESTETWQQVLESWVAARMLDLAKIACYKQQELLGKIAYDAEQWIEIIKNSTTVTLSEVV